jgi:hypothetical protein
MGTLDLSIKALRDKYLPYPRWVAIIFGGEHQGYKGGPAWADGLRKEHTYFYSCE